MKCFILIFHKYLTMAAIDDGYRSVGNSSSSEDDVVVVVAPPRVVMRPHHANVAGGAAPPARHPVVVRQKRKYVKASREVRLRVIQCANRGEDWKQMAIANGVLPNTAVSWIKSGKATPTDTGGLRHVKITDEHHTAMENWLEINPSITLQEICEKLQVDFNIQVSTSTVHKHLEGLMYTVKKPHYEPELMNSEENKMKRRNFVVRIMALVATKILVYIDETNVNLHCHRDICRAKSGKRGVVIAPGSKGPNLHIIGAVSQHGLEFWERQRGSFNNVLANAWIERLLRTLADKYDLRDVVIVCDNAPCHSRVQQVFEMPANVNAQLIRLGPYSPQLNPIENVWSFVKASFKRLHAERLLPMLQEEERAALGVSKMEHRIRYLERIVDDSMPTVTRVKCLQCFNHVQQYYPGCLALEDIPVG